MPPRVSAVFYRIRPTHGRVSLEGACALAPSFDTAGWFARDAALLERVGQVLLGAASAGAHGRVLLADDALALTAPGAMAALQPALARVGKALGAPQAVRVSAEGLPQWFETFRILQAQKSDLSWASGSIACEPKMGPGVRDRMQWTTTISEGAVAQAQEARAVVRDRMDALLADRAVLVLPTVPDIAPLRDASAAAPDDFRARMMSLFLLFLTKPLAYMPNAVLAAVVFLIGVELVDVKGMRKIFAQRPAEFWVALITATVVVFVGIEQGILLAMILSILIHVRHGYQPKELPAGGR